MSSAFFFSLMRITCAQIFRAAGIDRCSPSLLDTLTDLIIRHMMLLAETSVKIARLSGRDEVQLEDLALAMEEVGVIKPIAKLDPYDVDPKGIEGYELFIDWAKGPIPEEARRVACWTKESASNDSESSTTVTNTNSTTQSNMPPWLTDIIKKNAKIDHEAKLRGTLLAADGSDNVPTYTDIVGPEDNKDGIVEKLVH